MIFVIPNSIVKLLETRTPKVYIDYRLENYDLDWLKENIDDAMAHIAENKKLRVIDIRLGNFYPPVLDIANEQLSGHFLIPILEKIMKYIGPTTHITTLKVWYGNNRTSAYNITDKLQFQRYNEYRDLIRKVRSIKFLFIQGYELRYLALRHLPQSVWLWHNESCYLLWHNTRDSYYKRATLFDLVLESKNSFTFVNNIEFKQGFLYIVKKKQKQISYRGYEFYFQLEEEYGILKKCFMNRNFKTKYVAYVCVGYIVRGSRHVQGDFSLKRLRITYSNIDHFNYINPHYIPKS